jgi:O-acetyl-ADP-ribose deacetylase (regulator of RNase III)
MSKLEVVQGDLLDQDVDVIVNAWNRNIIPWLNLSGGVKPAPFITLSCDKSSRRSKLACNDCQVIHLGGSNNASITSSTRRSRVSGIFAESTR